MKLLLSDASLLVGSFQLVRLCRQMQTVLLLNLFIPVDAPTQEYNYGGKWSYYYGPIGLFLLLLLVVLLLVAMALV